MSKGDWIDSVKEAIITKSGIYIRKDSQLEEIEKHASAKMGLKRVVKTKNDSATHYASKLVKHFDLGIKKPKHFKTSKATREDAMKKRGVKKTDRGTFGKANKGHSLEVTPEDQEKYLKLLEQTK